MKSQSVENLKAPFQLEVVYFPCVSSNSELQELALHIFAAWLARAVIRRAGIEANTSHTAAPSTQPALTSHPNDCTVGTPKHCKTGGSDK